MSADASLQILIDVRSRLEELTKAQTAIRDLGKEATSAGQALKTGLGVEAARRGLDLLTGTVRGFFVEAFRMAGAIKDNAQNLGISNQAYQVLGNTIRDAGGDASLLTQAVSNSNRSLLDARSLGSAAAGAYRTLGLDIAKLEQMPVERRFELIGRAVLRSTDKIQAYSAASQILGSRNLPTLLGALKDVAENGWDKITDAQVRAGRVMTDGTIARVESAIKDWERVKLLGTVFVGEQSGGALASWDAIKSGLQSDLPGFFQMLGKTSFETFFAPWRNFTGESALVKWLQKNAPAAQTFPGVPTSDGAANEIALKNALAEAEYNLASAQLHRQTIENDPNFTGLSVVARRLGQMEHELKLRTQLIAVLNAAPLDPTETKQSRDLRLQKYEEQNQQMKDEIRRINNTNQFNDTATATRDKYNDFRSDSAGDKQDLGDSLQLGAMDWVTSLGNAGQQVAGVLQSSLGAVVDGISQGIYGWITGTMSFGQAMLNLGSSVLQMVLHTIVQMGVQMLVNAALGRFLAAATAAANLAAAAAIAIPLAAIWAAPATLATIATVGGAAAQAPASIGIAKALVLAQSALGFAEGGVVRGAGTGTSDSIPAWLSNGEGILTASAVSRLGPGFVDAVNAGAPVSVAASASPALAGSSGAAPAAPGGAGGGNVSVAVFLDETSAMAWLGSRTGKKILYRKLGAERGELGLET